jgi:hypothetical protein
MRIGRLQVAMQVRLSPNVGFLKSTTVEQMQCDKVNQEGSVERLMNLTEHFSRLTSELLSNGHEGE